MGLRYYEDIESGESRRLGSHEMRKDAIVSFAEQFDPQPFHVDEAAAADSEFGGIIASGLHTMSVAQLLVTEGFYAKIANVAGLGIDETRFRAPVRPGDTLTANIVIADKSDISRDDCGLVVVDQTLRNQDDDVVLTNQALTLVERRDRPA